MAPADRQAVSYTPGTWLGVVRSGTVVLLRPDTDRALVDSLWTLLGENPEIHEVLDAVTSASGGPLARLPWFGIVGLRGSLQVFLRGGIDLEVTPEGAGGAPVALSGRDVTTWTERRFASAQRFSVAIPDAGPAGNQAEAPAPLPLDDGVVLLQGLYCELTGNGTAAAMPEAVMPAAPADDRLLAAAEADIAAEQTGHFSSDETVLDFPEEDEAPLPEAPGPEAQTQEAPEPETSAPVPAEQEPTGSYDHLWEQTVMRKIEDAAVRVDPEAGQEPDAAPEAEPQSTAPEPTAAGKPAGKPAAATASAPAAAAIPTGLIDSVPWHTGGDRSAPSAAPAQRPGPGPAAPPSFSMQVASTQGPSPLAPQPADADHDGQTIVRRSLPGVTGQATARPGTPPAAKDPVTGPMVLARVCPQGHANPPTNAQCAYCGQPLAGDGVQVRRPRLGRVRLSTGELIDLDQSLIVGRQPSVSRVQGAVMPKLVQVPSPGGDISRSHVEVRLEGWHVMLCDLKATNGTVLLREGQAPRRLAQGEMAILFDGDIAELGDGVQLRFEELL